MTACARLCVYVLVEPARAFRQHHSRQKSSCIECNRRSVFGDHFAYASLMLTHVVLCFTCSNRSGLVPKRVCRRHRLHVGHSRLLPPRWTPRRRRALKSKSGMQWPCGRGISARIRYVVVVVVLGGLYTMCTLQHAVRCWKFSDTVGLFFVATFLAKCCICTVRHLSQFAQRAQH